MLDRQDTEPVPEPAFFAPFVSSVMRVEPGWIDYNGHLNMAYYNVLFDRAVDEAYELSASGWPIWNRPGIRPSPPKCISATCASLMPSDPVRVTFQLLDYDAKRIHYFEQLHHAEQGWLSATSENMTLHVDMTAKKTAPFPGFIAARLARMKAAHAHLPVPDGVGRRIAMPSAK